MSKARGLADLGNVYNDGALSNRNLIINGAMQVAQRATSVTGFGGGSDAYTTVDRWLFDLNSTMAGRMTIEQVNDSPNGISGKSLKLSCTTADTSIGSAERVQIQQRIEGQDLQNIGKGTPEAKPVTVSFYVKANASFTYGLELYDGDNGRQITKLFTTTTEWNRIELTFPADTTGTFDNDNNNSLYLLFAIHAGSSYASGALNSEAWASAVNANRAAGIDSFYSSTDNELFITGVQLEVGDTATPFEHRSYGQELALCQRYYERLSAETDYSYIGVGVGASATIAQAHITYQKKRAIPSLSGVGDFMLYSGYDATVSNVTFVHITSTRCTGYFYSTGLTVGRAYKAQFHAAGDRYIAIDAEL